jgi:hypothetical protein
MSEASMSSLAKVESRNSVEVTNQCSWVCCMPHRKANKKKHNIEPLPPAKTECPLTSEEQKAIDKAADKAAEAFANASPPPKALW